MTAAGAQTPAPRDSAQRPDARTDARTRADSARARRLNPVVVTATRDARELRRLPVSVTVVDTGTIARTTQVSLTEALRTVPGVVAGNLFGGDDVRLSIRGSGARGGFGVRGVGILLDGVPITDPDGQTRLDQLDLGAARSIEVVRGPASAMYGGAASGGVVNVITKSGREAAGLSLRTVGGGFGFDSVNLRRLDAAWGGARDTRRGAVDAYLSGSVTDIAGFRQQSPNNTNRANVRLNWARPAADPATATRVGLDASWSDLDMRIPGALTTADWQARPWAADPLNVVGNYGRREERYRFGARLQQGLGARFGALEAFAFGTARTIDHPIFRVVDQNTHRVQGGLRHAVDGRVGPDGDVRLRLSTGLDLDRWYGSSRQWTNAGGRAVTATPCVNDRARGVVSVPCVNQFVTLPGLGAYTQLDATRGRWSLALGARHDRVTYDIDDRIRPAQSVNTSFGQTSPRASLRFEPRPGVSVYTSVARGFEVPTNAELTASPDTLRGFNADLRPSSLVNYETGVKALVGSRMLVDVALFRTDVRGEFLSRTIVIPGVQFPRTIFENVGRSRRTGLEASTTLMLGRLADVVTSYTFSDFVLTEFSGTEVGPDGRPVARDYAGKLLPGVPRHRGALELRLRPARGLGVTVWGEAQSRVFVDNANTASGVVFSQVAQAGGPPRVVATPFRAAPGYGLLHANVNWRVPTGRLAAGAPRVDLFVNADNLLDRRFVAAVATNAGNGRFFFPGAGRMVTLGLSLAAGGR